MCWSLRVSVAAFIVAYGAAIHIWKRNATPRDRWNAIFLFVFSSMQLIDALIWYIHDFEGPQQLGPNCSNKASVITILGLMIIIFEPISCMMGCCYARGKFFTKMELIMYVVANLSVQFVFGYVVSNCFMTKPCPFITDNGHLLYAFGGDSEGGAKCWREYGFFGEISHEIPLWLRIMFLVGMVYPYVFYMVPTGAGLIQAAILTATWTVGYFSDSHASIWCNANVLQAITMFLDPYFFPPPPEPGYSPIPHKGTNIRDIYNKRKVGTKAFDYIVVGSGIGGLSSAALLSRAGYRVLVLEKHFTAGGCTHTFTKGGNTFDSGVHYVSSSFKLRAMLSYIVDRPGVQLAMLGDEPDYCYDEFDLGEGLTVRYCRGREALQKELERKFPEEKDAIKLFFEEKLPMANTSMGALSLLKILPQWIVEMKAVKLTLFKKLAEGVDVTAWDVVNDTFKDKRLKALIAAGQMIDWNLQPNKVCWAIVGGMLSYYMDGATYPGDNIASRIIPIIERGGGRVLVRATVKEFLMDHEPGLTEGHIVGVKMENGDELFARQGVISDIGFINTLCALPEQYRKDLNDLTLTPSNGHMTAFISLDGPAKDFDLKSCNIHSWTSLPKFDYDPNKMQEEFYNKPLENARDCLMTLTCPCVKDPNYTSPTGNVLLLTEAKWSWFENMDLEEVKAFYNSEGGLPHGKRPQEYLDFKKKWEDVFLEKLYQYYPKTKGHVASIEIGTPVTSNHFITAPQGGSYGLSWDRDHFNEKVLLKRFPPGLTIAGETALFGGIAGALGGGYIAAFRCLGVWKFLKVILTTEPISTYPRPKSNPALEKMERDHNESLLLTTMVAVIGLMLGGRRFGKILLKKGL